ncbi:MAG: 6-phosphogluconolactonase [Terracidiphilus sp.]|jgi:glucosamine-6-phosphate deaminase
MAVRRFRVDNLKIEIHPDSESAGKAAAEAAAQCMRQLAARQESIGIIFGTGASQLHMLRALVSIPGLPWESVVGFHMDEYIGLDENHRASLRHYLRNELTSRVHMREFTEVNGNADPAAICREYAAKLRAANPQLCLLGFGENGHLAFNEPDQADFKDPVDAKIVTLDTACRKQQLAEGWFDGLEEVPAQAISLTIPALFRVPKLILSIPGPRKTHIVKRSLTEPISTDCPATILRTHPDATAYLDPESGAELDSFS